MLENGNFDKNGIIDKNKNAMWQTPAANKRFGEMAAGVTAQAVLFRETVRYSPSCVQLNPPLRQAAGTSRVQAARARWTET